MAAARTTRTRASTKKDLDDLRSSRAAAEPEDAKTKTVRRARKAKVEQDVADVTVEKVAGALTKAELEVAKNFSAVREIFGKEIEQLATIREAIEIKKAEMEELHGKETIALSIDDLIAQYDEKEAELNAKIQASKDTWIREQAEHERMIKERGEALEAARKKANDEYDFNLKVTRRNDNDKWEEHVRTRQRELTEIEEKAFKAIADREEAVAEREERIEELEAIEASFDERVEEAAVKRVKEAESKLHAHYQNQLKIQQLEFDAKLKLQEQQANNLQSILAQAEQRADKEAQAKASLEAKFEGLASKALAVQAGEQAMEAVQKTLEKTGQQKR